MDLLRQPPPVISPAPAMAVAPPPPPLHPPLQLASSTSLLTAASSSASAAASVSRGAVFGADSYDDAFGQHVNTLRNTMFYVCQGSCLCGTVNNRGKVIYCYGDLVPRHGELFAEGNEGGGGGSGTTSKDLLAAQLAVWTFGIIALLIVLLLIRKSIASLKRHLERVTDRLPVHYDDDDDILSDQSMSSPPPPGTKDTTMEHMDTGGDMFSDDGTLTPDPGMEESPLHIGVHRLASTSKPIPVENLKKMRLHRKDFKKGGEALRGKNVTEAFRVKEKDMKRTMK